MESGVTLHRLEMQPIRTMFVYDRVLKDPDAFLMKKLASEYTDQFKEYIDTNQLNTLSLEYLTAALIDRDVKNPLEWLAKKPFDYEGNYKFLKDQFKNMYYASIPLYGWTILDRFTRSFASGDIFIWNETDDVRQKYDIVSNFDNPGIKYITGDYFECINQIHPNLIYDWDADRVHMLLKDELHEDIFVGVANYEFNFSKEDRVMLKHNLSYRKNIAYYTLYHSGESATFKG